MKVPKLSKKKLKKSNNLFNSLQINSFNNNNLQITIIMITIIILNKIPTTRKNNNKIINKMEIMNKIIKLFLYDFIRHFFYKVLK